MSADLFQTVRQRLTQGPLPNAVAGTTETTGLGTAALIELFESQLQSRLLDYQAQRLQSQGHGYYTIAGGRHKVLGSKALKVPPQTSTIASHLPKAVGAVHSLDLWQRLVGAGEWPGDSLILCSFGDASLNHSNLCWLTDIDHKALYTAVQDCPRILVVDECRRRGSISEELISELSALGVASGCMDRLTALDSFIALGEAVSTSIKPRSIGFRLTR